MPYNIYSYPKFGDHCIAYGIVKEFAKEHKKINYYSDEMNDNTFETNVRLFSSLKNVELIREPYKGKPPLDFSIAHTAYWFDKVRSWYDDVNKLMPSWYSDEWRFDRQWYLNANVQFNLKWDNFFFKRDLKKEKEIYYDVLGLKDGEEFVFLHEDPSRGWFLDRKFVQPNIKIIEFQKLDVNILDILYTIEMSKEVHTFNTGLLSFIDLKNIFHPNLNYHKYIRPMPFEQPILKLKWNIIE